MTEHSSKNLTRRTFVRSIGTGLVSIVVVDILSGGPRPAFACGESPPDSTCGTNYAGDEGCGRAGDPDNNCGPAVQNSADSNCGKPSTGGTATAGPGGTDVDEACKSAVSDSDDNCGISYNPSPALDEDNSCNEHGGDADQSCGDCNDNHQTDEHCGEEMDGGVVDSDELCGHQHVISGTTDSVCSDTQPDNGCGVHSNDYAPFDWTDTDEYCTGTHVDRNCSAATTDSTCNASHSPSSTSPDENCSSTDMDDACSLYDRDESCGNGNIDEACGVTTIGGWPDKTDQDANCGTGTDPDDSSGYPCPLGSG